ncbi:hypothetical protein ACKC9G_09380 [Pokkaliibacter sp. CJK22405]|uniref:hypothetical protein n=1 Tax=Pokkaliibacter sp. CJK22405 TaxID=3384615 RepID=UPI0039854B57
MARKAKRPIVKTTLLIVGEGADDEAFINHMKELFFRRQKGNKGPKIESGDGGSAGNIITNALRTFKADEYDCKLFVLDSDLPPNAEDSKKAREGGFDIILWSPQSLEGALLDVLGERVNEHETSQDLKKRLHPRLNGPHTQSRSYAALFPKVVLESTTNSSVVDVRNAISDSNP